MVVDKREPGGYVTPVEAAGEFATYVSRIREDATVENGLALWIVSDNLLKGAALNAVQIAETLINRKLLKRGLTAVCGRGSPRAPAAIHSKSGGCGDRAAQAFAALASLSILLRALTIVLRSWRKRSRCWDSAAPRGSCRRRA